ncbi:AfsR/SARP family transcriptional regulator [Streptomyces kunmingensis]|uniref:AfsR/SARP family transcriptional regulator n=1 Tax=Streptomyces kunmingensis TaxID=68225 RepID=A0ABU6C7V6_9ACTN|nr:AfsR/SARP family transcriptional regulator [Streptomyces kunmingensis]MEB3960687.1 AfsR/SARP family transcriptional regulator [Streptomyces kunmingensis]
MQIQVLGPMRATVNGKTIVPSAGKPRQVFALLALYSGRVLPISTLMEEIWRSELPPSAATTLQTYIMQLRRGISAALGPGSGGEEKRLLATGHGGYLLQIPPQSVDVNNFETLAAEGQTAFGRGEDERAAHAFEQALALWQGQALMDVRLGPVLEIEAMRLEEARLVTVERRIDTDLRLGRHAGLLTELIDLITRHPHHEGLHAQAMLALYRAGQRPSALDVYRRLRVRLVEELGVEPSPQLQRLRQAIISLDPALDVTAEPRRRSTFDRYAAQGPSDGI